MLSASSEEPLEQTVSLLVRYGGFLLSAQKLEEQQHFEFVVRLMHSCESNMAACASMLNVKVQKSTHALPL